MPTIIRDHGNVAMAPFMDNHAASATDFKTLYQFLKSSYFLRVAFRLIYLNPLKTAIFTDSLNLLGFTSGPGNIRPSIKHHEKILNWPIPQNWAQLDGFLYLTPFLQNFILG